MDSISLPVISLFIFSVSFGSVLGYWTCLGIYPFFGLFILLVWNSKSLMIPCISFWFHLVILSVSLSPFFFLSFFFFFFFWGVWLKVYQFCVYLKNKLLFSLIFSILLVYLSALIFIFLLLTLGFIFSAFSGPFRHNVRLFEIFPIFNKK